MTTTGTTPPPHALRRRAAEIVAELAGRLSDPDEVVAAAAAERTVDHVPGRPAAGPPWTPLGLAEGHPGVALLFTALSHRSDEYRSAAHAHLRAAAAGLAGPQPTGLFGGPTSLAFAARVARHRPGDYARLLESLDAWISRRLSVLLAAERKRLAAGRAGVRLSTFDVISGTAGLSRYLLLAPDRHRPLLDDTLRHLVRLTRPVEVNGRALPGWWAPPEPGLGPQAPGGHANLGLAHGISGPLAALSLAWRSGIRVAGQRQAITAVADHLLEWQNGNGLWPRLIGYDVLPTGPRGRPEGAEMVAWCYGTPGTARALQLAGLALDRADWQRHAVTALSAALDEPSRAIRGATLCHGWAGVLHITTLMALDSGDRSLIGRLPDLLKHVLDTYDPSRPFGFRYDHPHRTGIPRPARHRAGFLTGAAGIALALTLHTPDFDAGATTALDAALLLD